MAVGAGFDYFSTSVSRVRLGELGAAGRGSSTSAPVVVKLLVWPVGVSCGSASLGGLSGFDGCGHRFAAVWRSKYPLAYALVSSRSRFVRLLLGRVPHGVRWR